ncbi:glycosyltransferase family 4 protein [Aeromonas salmonicida]|uniref:glycosyltransferase family 4 protein n=1 Tax=Aeromonas salmonicida TaxID=645 RepID=UPI0038BA4409
MIKRTAKLLKSTAQDFCYKHEKLATFWASKYIKNDISCATKSRQFFQKLKDIYPTLALNSGKVAVEHFFDPTFNTVYANRLEKIGRIDESNALKEKLIDISIVKPSYKDTDKVFKVLSARSDYISAKGWINFLRFREKENIPLISRKYFLYFKDIDKKGCNDLGWEYLSAYPHDEKFAAVYLKRASGILCSVDYKTLLTNLNEKHQCDLYKNKLDVINSKIEAERILKDSDTLEKIQQIIASDREDKLTLIKFVFDNSECVLVKNKCVDFLQDNKNLLDHVWLRKISDHYLSRGDISDALDIVKNSSHELIQKKHASISSFYNLYKNGYINSLGGLPLYKKVGKKNRNALYLLHNRLPYNSGGYATRSHGLLTSIKQWWNISGVSRLGYPQDRKGLEAMEFTPFHEIDNVKYHCLKAEGNSFGQIPISNYIDEYSKELLELCSKEKPSIIHAASNYMNGLAANNVAKRLGIKSVYEVRGLWEITRISRDPDWKDTEYYNMMSQLEAQAAKDADAVFTLTNALKNELINRGVAAEKIHLLPNGVDSSRFIPKIRNNKLALNLGIEDKVVIGFLGSVVQYEGVEYIIQAASILKKQGLNNFVVLIVGDGAVLDNVKAITSELHMDEHVKFTGRVPHDEIEDYYSIVDICPLPRKGLPVCEMVSPLKPFEAMAMGKVVVSSDVAALAEIIDDGVTGLLHKKDDPEDLANKIRLLIEDHDLRDRLGKSAREWVVAERDWKVIAKRVDTVYRNLLGQ